MDRNPSGISGTVRPAPEITLTLEQKTLLEAVIELREGLFYNYHYRIPHEKKRDQFCLSLFGISWKELTWERQCLWSEVFKGWRERPEFEERQLSLIN